MPGPDQWREGKTFLLNGGLEPPFQSIPGALRASLGGTQSQEEDAVLSRQCQLYRAPQPASDTRSDSRLHLLHAPARGSGHNSPSASPQVPQFCPFSQLVPRPQPSAGWLRGAPGHRGRRSWQHLWGLMRCRHRPGHRSTHLNFPEAPILNSPDPPPLPPPPPPRAPRLAPLSPSAAPSPSLRTPAPCAAGKRR